VILIVDETYLDFDKVRSILITYEENKTIRSNVVWWNPFTWGSFPTVESDPTYVLKMEYIRGHEVWTFTCRNTDITTLRTKFKKIVDQLKMQVDVQNQEMLDKLFEAAITNGGTP